MSAPSETAPPKRLLATIAENEIANKNRGRHGKKALPEFGNVITLADFIFQPLNGASNSRLSSTPKPGLFGSRVTLLLTGSGSPSSTAKIGWMASPLPTERYS